MATHRHKRETNARLSTLLGSLKSRPAAQPGRRVAERPARASLPTLPRWSSPALVRSRVTLVAAPLAVVATAGAVAYGVVGEDPAPGASAIATDTGADTANDTASDTAGAYSDVDPGAAARDQQASRGGSRGASDDPGDSRRNQRLSAVAELTSPASVAAAIDGADTRRYTTTELNLWDDPTEGATQTGELEAGKRVLLTGRESNGRVEIVWKQTQTRWVTSGYTSEDKPLGAGAGLSMDPCPDGGVESGLTESAVAVYRAVCNAFPQITTYGGYDAHGEHSSGRAIDIMTSDVALGTAIADFLRENAAALNLYDVIWRQRIWTPVRASEGWRFMPSRGSATANHYDHVHVAVN